MDESAIKDEHHEQYLKVFSKLHNPLGECDLKAFPNNTSSVNP